MPLNKIKDYVDKAVYVAMLGAGEMKMNNYRAELSISYKPETENLFDLELIQEAAENYLCEHIQDFGGLGESDKYELKDIWAKHKIALVTFVVEFATANFEELEDLSYEFEDLGEI